MDVNNKLTFCFSVSFHLSGTFSRLGSPKEQKFERRESLLQIAVPLDLVRVLCDLSERNPDESDRQNAAGEDASVSSSVQLHETSGYLVTPRTFIVTSSSSNSQHLLRRELNQTVEINVEMRPPVPTPEPDTRRIIRTLDTVENSRYRSACKVCLAIGTQKSPDVSLNLRLFVC